MNPKLIIHFQGQFVYCLRLYYLISRHKMTTFDDQYSYYVDFLQLSQKNTIEYFSEQCQCNVQKWKKSNTMSHSIFIQLTWHFVNLFLNSSWESDFEEEQDQNLFRTTHIIVCIMHMQQNRVHLCCLVLTNSTLKIQGAAVISRILLTSRFWKNHCQYRNKPYISKKPLISAFIWHLETACIFKMDF